MYVQTLQDADCCSPARPRCSGNRTRMGAGLAAVGDGGAGERCITGAYARGGLGAPREMMCVPAWDEGTRAGQPPRALRLPPNWVHLTKRTLDESRGWSDVCACESQAASPDGGGGGLSVRAFWSMDLDDGMCVVCTG